MIFRLNSFSYPVMLCFMKIPSLFIQSTIQLLQLIHFQTLFYLLLLSILPTHQLHPHPILFLFVDLLECPKPLHTYKNIIVTYYLMILVLKQHNNTLCPKSYPITPYLHHINILSFKFLLIMSPDFITKLLIFLNGVKP